MLLIAILAKMLLLCVHVFLLFICYFLKYIDILQFHSRMIFFATRPLWTPLAYRGWNQLTSHFFSSFTTLFIVVEVSFIRKEVFVYHDCYLELIFLYAYLQAFKIFSDIKAVFWFEKWQFQIIGKLDYLRL